MPWLTENVALAGRRELSAWRSLALAVWRDVGTASVHAVIEVDAAPMLALIERLNRQAREESDAPPVTMVHCIGKAVAELYRQLPDLNCLLRLGGLYRRRDVDVFFPVALDRKGADMSGVVLRGVDGMPLRTVAAELKRAAWAVRRNRRGDFGALRADGVVGRLAARALIRVGGLLLYTLNVWHPALGVPQDAFGGAAVSDVSRFGADLVFPPLLPMARLPLVIGICPLADVPVWADGGWRVQKTLRLAAVFDHRVIDGVYAGRMSRLLREICAQPDAHLG